MPPMPDGLHVSSEGLRRLREISDRELADAAGRAMPVYENNLLGDEQAFYVAHPELPRPMLDIGVIRDSTLFRSNDLQLFMEEWVSVAAAFKTTIAAAADAFKSLARAFSPHGDWRITAAIKAGVTEADIRDFERHDDGWYVRRWNHRRIRIGDL